MYGYSSLFIFKIYLFEEWRLYLLWCLQSVTCVTIYHLHKIYSRRILNKAENIVENTYFATMFLKAVCCNRIKRVFMWERVNFTAPIAWTIQYVSWCVFYFMGNSYYLIIVTENKMKSSIFAIACILMTLGMTLAANYGSYGYPSYGYPSYGGAQGSNPLGVGNGGLCKYYIWDHWPSD